MTNPITAAEFVADLNDGRESPEMLMARLREAGWFGPMRDGPDLSSVLAHTLHALGWRGDLLSLRDALPGHLGEMDLVDMFNTLANLGYSYREGRGKLLKVPRADYPVLLAPDSHPNKLFILHQRTMRGWQAQDAHTGEVMEMTGGRLSGIFYAFTAIGTDHENHENQARARVGYTWFNNLLGRFGGLLGQLLVLSLFINVVALAPSIYVMVVYNQVIGASSLASLGRSANMLLLLALGTLIFIGAEAGLRFIRLYALSWFGSRLNTLVSSAVFRQLLMLPSIYTERVSVAAQIARIKAFESVRDFFSGPAFLVVLELPMVLVLIGFTAVIGGPLCFVSLGMLALYTIILGFCYRRLTLMVMRAARSAAERQHAAIEIATHLHTLKYNGVTGALLSRFLRMSHQAVKDSFKTSLSFGVIEHIANAGTALAGVTTLTWGVYRIWSGDLSVGALVVLMLLTWRILGPLQSACSLLPRLHSVQQSIEQVNRLMRMRPEQEEQNLCPVSAEFRGAVQFVHVGLRYARKSSPVFLGLDLDIEPGELVAVAGAAGTGKSSLLKMACGLYAPQAGAIRFDDVDIRQYEPASLRGHLSYLPQHPDFFSGSILDNLRLNMPDAGEHAVKLALTRADAWDEVDAMPESIHTEIGAGRLKLSSSLATKINLARIYLNPHAILLLDELPYSILSSRAGERFREFLRQSKGAHTILFVTHRNDYIAMADKVLILRRDSRPVIMTPEQALSTQGKALA